VHVEVVNLLPAVGPGVDDGAKAARHAQFAHQPRRQAQHAAEQGVMLMKAFDTINQQGHTIEHLSQQLAQANAEVLQAHKEVMRLSHAHTDATSKANTEFANAVSKLAEQSRERKKDGQGPGR
jgi:hypothetical protein